MEETVTAYRSALLSRLAAEDPHRIYAEPLDPVKLGIPHYRLVIKHPMDLRTIQCRIEDGDYGSGEEGEEAERLCWQDDAAFFDDVARVYLNGIRFFPPASRAHRIARRLLQVAREARDDALAQIKAVREREAREEREQQRAMDALDAAEAEAASSAATASARGKAKRQQPPTRGAAIPYYVIREMMSVIPGLPPDLIGEIVLILRPSAKLEEEVEVDLHREPIEAVFRVRALLDARKVKYAYSGEEEGEGGGGTQN